MSCDNPTQSVEEIMPRRRKFDKTGICIKCKTTPGKIVIRHTVYCKDCFLALVIAKFRRTLDSTINPLKERTLARGVLKASGNLMIGFSGGLTSTALLDLVKRCYLTSGEANVSKGGKNHPRKSGKVWNRVFICYVECCEGLRDVRDRTEDVKAALDTYRDIAEILIIRLEDAFKVTSPGIGSVSVDPSREVISTSQEKNVSPATLLRLYLASLPTLTSYQSTISSLTRLLLQYAAHTNGCSHLLLGTTLTGLSVNLINSIASGGGFAIGMENAEDWQTENGEVVRVVRPLREISMKECAAYLRWRNLSVIDNERILTESPNTKESIGDLTKKFIHGLERNYPSTVSAIVRTCGKLVSNTGGSTCVLCERPAQPGVQQWKERISIRSIEGSTVSADTGVPANGSEALASRLCYACHTTLTSKSSRGARKPVRGEDSSQILRLPEWVGRNIEVYKRHARAEMKAHIEDFLFDEDSDDART